MERPNKEILVLKEDFECDFDCCPQCNHQFNPKIKLTKGTQLTINRWKYGSHIHCETKYPNGSIFADMGDNPRYRAEYVWEQALKVGEIQENTQQTENK